VLAVALAAALAPVAHASRGDIYIETDHYAVDDFDAVHLLRIDPQSGAVSTVASSTKLPAYGPPTFVRADGTVLMADLNRGVAVDPSGQVRTLAFSLPGHRFGLASQPVALGFLPSGRTAYGVAGEGVYSAGSSLDGRLVAVAS
jgi:hypothetical protein